MEQESATLREAIRNREDELRELRKIREEGHKGAERSANKHTHTHMSVKLSTYQLSVNSVFNSVL